MKKILAIALLLPTLALATVADEFCAANADTAVNIAKDKMSKADFEALMGRIAPLDSTDPITLKISRVGRAVMIKAQYSWRGLSDDTVSKLAFSTCSLELLKARL